MHIHFEQNTYTRTDSNFHSLSWMGKVPDSLPDEGGGWKLNRAQYYMEGWLASGNAKGVVGVTFTTCHCRRYEAPPRSNFNLRGHRSEVILVKWNEPYQRLATCDSRGVIFVWIKHEGRWSIELINDRNSQVTDFAWSHDGRMALICYRDGFVLVGSVAGQRYWSSMLNLDNTSILCGIWSPDDQQVMFGTSDGQLIVMSSTGAMVSQVTINEGFEITSMTWSCEKFNMEEADNRGGAPYGQRSLEEKNHTLAVCFKYGDIFLMSDYHDPCPRIISTSLTGLKIEWSNCGQYLAVGGFLRLPNLQCRNELHFYSCEGKRIHWVPVPSQGKPLTALTWGHNDKRLFLAAGCQLYVAWVSKQVAPLQFLSQRVIHRLVRHEKSVLQLPLPVRLRQGVQSLFSPTVKSYIPDPFKLRAFISTPPPGRERMFCTMIRHGDETSGGHYTLYLEYLGGLVPLLKGKRASKLRPDFVIFDPKIRTSSRSQGDSSAVQTDSSSESEADVVTDGCGSPRMQRRRRHKVFRAEKVDRSITFRTLDELLYNDNLPETNKLVEVTSNIWGTKFQITGVASYLPSMLGQVVYKTSLLHLQPRQMTITLQEIYGSTQPLARDPNFTPAGASDDDDEGCWPFSGDRPELPADISTSITASEPWTDENPSQISVDVQTPCGPAVTSDHLNFHEPETGSVFINNIEDNNNNNNGGGGVGGVVTTRLNHTGSIRGHTFSPVRDNRTQPSTLAFSVDPAVHKDAYIAQGARPKTCNNSLPKRPSSVKASTPSVTSSTTTTFNPTTTTTTYANGSIFASATTTTTSSTTTSTTTTTTTTIDNTNFDASETAVVPIPITCSPISPEPEAAGILKRVAAGGSTEGPRWADPASQAIKYIDEEASDVSELPFENNMVADCSLSSAPSSVLLQRRLYLAQRDDAEEDEDSDVSHPLVKGQAPASPGGGDPEKVGLQDSDDDSPPQVHADHDLTQRAASCKNGVSVTAAAAVLANGLGCNDIEILQSASLPASPLHSSSRADTPTRKVREELLKAQCHHLSPVLRRKGKHECNIESLDDELVLSVMEDFKGGMAYHNLETFQKAQLKHKMRRAQNSSSQMFVMHNKAPLWNENSQVYQLDFGGRVTQESAKNFQIELLDRQVMQFGRIDSNAYTLDFQYPFTALQAFAVALANVTQRLK
ncbi:tubby-related protein 4-like isoform X2 [Pomacea canaliculata]|uniref:tubby-related protein 4-like isoform X2 n=1 Tax=Pomacea canaliculata TaxID=400727 RepID=UPI000D72C669|nr:tubby-related protein 4-like isoform X2 [Pomacea canaliculata]